MNLTLKYFAILREQRGLSQEQVDIEVDSASDLYAVLKARHAFTLNADQLRITINDNFVGSEASLSEGDVVVFIPPVAGG